LAPGKKNTRSCIICGQSFRIESISKGRISARRTCSRACRGKLYAQTRRNWTKEEVAFLKDHAESMPCESLIRVFNAQNKIAGRPKRSAVSIKLKVDKLGYSLEPKYRYLSASALARVLGISNDAVRYWLQIGLKGVRNRDVPRSPVYITATELRKFARNNPRFFGGIPRIDLYIALEDEDLADQIFRQYPNRNSCIKKPVRVKCVETGRIYNSQSDAARAIYVNRSIVFRAVKYGHRAAGYHFIALDS
jgi:hypothetical protein